MLSIHVEIPPRTHRDAHIADMLFTCVGKQIEYQHHVSKMRRNRNESNFNGSRDSQDFRRVANYENVGRTSTSSTD